MKLKLIIFYSMMTLVVSCSGKNYELDASRDKILIGTGGIAGLYYPTGKSLCSFVNENQNELFCEAKVSKGSVDNLQLSQSKKIDFGIAQSDRVYEAYKGVGEFRYVGEIKNIRTVFSLYSEPVTLVVRDDLDIKSITDLLGKNVNIGRVNSQSEEFWNLVWSAYGYSGSDVNALTNLSPKKAAEALCNKKIDAYFWVLGNPNRITHDVIANCNAKILNLNDIVIDNLIRSKPYLRHSKILRGVYPDMSYDINTFGVGPTVFTTAEESENTVYLFVKSIFENFHQFKKENHIYIPLDKIKMVSDSLYIPLHPGAIRYFEEVGLLEDET